MGDALVYYIFVSALLGIPRSLISIPVFGACYILNGGASGSNSDILGWASLFIVAAINTYGIFINARYVKRKVREKFFTP